ncbi:UNVERIFIED_CONTAM: ATP-binding cassette sub-family A member 5 [Trichonephila clavipes]
MVYKCYYTTFTFFLLSRIISDLDLTNHTRKKARHLSGGLKRKLCIALTLLGNSKLVLLDEPTTGMDPISKRNLWKRLHCEFPPMIDRTLVLSTHSSSEADVNCSRIVQQISGVETCFITECPLDQIILDLLEESANTNTEDTDCAARIGSSVV